MKSFITLGPGHGHTDIRWGISNTIYVYLDNFSVGGGGHSLPVRILWFLVTGN